MTGVAPVQSDVVAAQAAVDSTTALGRTIDVSSRAVGAKTAKVPVVDVVEQVDGVTVPLQAAQRWGPVRLFRDVASRATRTWTM
jgi:hypothetical protein